MRSFAVILLSLFFCSPTFAQSVIEDPNGVFGELRQWSPGLPFSQAFSCNQSASLESYLSSCRYHCNDFHCRTVCSPYDDEEKKQIEVFVEDCSQEQIYIYGDNGWSLSVTREDYVDSGHNWLKTFLEQVALLYVQPEGRIILHSVMIHPFEYISGGRKTEFLGQMVRGEFKAGDSQQGLGFEIGLAPRRRGLEQILLFRLEHDAPFVKLRGLFDAQMGRRF